jgi:hypothetical protein
MISRFAGHYVDLHTNNKQSYQSDTAVSEIMAVRSALHNVYKLAILFTSDGTAPLQLFSIKYASVEREVRLRKCF